MEENGGAWEPEDVAKREAPGGTRMKPRVCERIPERLATRSSRVSFRRLSKKLLSFLECSAKGPGRHGLI
ncbi:unnamed protein product [Caenorhabditis auriculariae]|uniref:Uncharacterized protein n=1 Tax=Caenorhabditis auriculariae TaxID=2777116 RepID=A0A8S1GUJ6_9PELO|nr:unnamed protein product [Caenorhabditis auriculariae]